MLTRLSVTSAESGMSMLHHKTTASKIHFGVLLCSMSMSQLNLHWLSGKSVLVTNDWIFRGFSRRIFTISTISWQIVSLITYPMLKSKTSKRNSTSAGINAFHRLLLICLCTIYAGTHRNISTPSTMRIQRRWMSI